MASVAGVFVFELAANVLYVRRRLAQAVADVPRAEEPETVFHPVAPR
jgi:hypothetical protein